MVKRFLAAGSVVIFAGALSFLAAANNPTQSWKGYVTDTWCGLHRETEAPTVACTKLCLSNKGAKYALFDVVNNKLYVLNPQDQAAKYAAQMVTVIGTLSEETKMVTAQGTIQGSTIIASSIVPAPSK